MKRNYGSIYALHYFCGVAAVVVALSRLGQDSPRFPGNLNYVPKLYQIVDADGLVRDPESIFDPFPSSSEPSCEKLLVFFLLRGYFTLKWHTLADGVESSPS